MSSSLAYPDFCDDKVCSDFSLFHFSRLCNTLMFEDLYVEVLPTKSHIGSKRSNTIRISIIIVVVIIIFTQFIYSLHLSRHANFSPYPIHLLLGKALAIPEVLFHWRWRSAGDSWTGHQPQCYTDTSQETVRWNPQVGWNTHCLKCYFYTIIWVNIKELWFSHVVHLLSKKIDVKN